MSKAPNQRFEHDCPKCEFLGQIGPDDLHYCPDEDSVILRDGDDGREYTSFPRPIAEVMVEHHAKSSARWQIALEMIGPRVDGRPV